MEAGERIVKKATGLLGVAEMTVEQQVSRDRERS